MGQREMERQPCCGNEGAPAAHCCGEVSRRDFIAATAAGA